MARLHPPDMRYRRSFVSAMDEFDAEGRGGADDDSMVGAELRAWRDRWGGDEGFAEFVAALELQATPGAPRPGHWVPCTTWWWVSGEEYLGRIAVRHELNERLRRFGGHIGYDVRPTARRRGHATAMLAAVLPHARSLGIDEALLTCDADNVASRRVIETNGGRLAWDDGGKLGFWVPTA